jgi:RNA polymerase sigma-70 factor (ECF subfamily)
MTSQDSFGVWAQQLQGGDPAAANQVVERFAQRLIALAASRLDPLLRSRVAPDDVVQSVFRSFFNRQRDGQFSLHGWDNLWSVLALITVRKCRNQVAHARAACRDVRREVPLADSAQEAAGLGLCSREPTPAEAIELAETVERLLGLFEPRERSVLQLGLQGHEVAAIAELLECTSRKVYRVLERARTELVRMLAEEPA